MEKLSALAAVAALCVCSPAQAQTRVWLSGYVDMSIKHLRSSGPGSTTRMSSGGLNNSRFNLSGVEELGDGNKAIFTIEPTFSANNGQQAAQFRQSFVGLKGAWGELTLGRQFTPSYWIAGYADPTWAAEFSMVNNMQFFYAPYRTDGAVQYKTPAFHGLSGRFMMSNGEGDSSKAGRFISTALEYREGPLFLGLASEQQHTKDIFGPTGCTPPETITCPRSIASAPWNPRSSSIPITVTTHIRPISRSTPGLGRTARRALENRWPQPPLRQRGPPSRRRKQAPVQRHRLRRGLYPRLVQAHRPVRQRRPCTARPRRARAVSRDIPELSERWPEPDRLPDRHPPRLLNSRHWRIRHTPPAPTRRRHVHPSIPRVRESRGSGPRLPAARQRHAAGIRAARAPKQVAPAASSSATPAPPTCRIPTWRSGYA